MTLDEDDLRSYRRRMQAANSALALKFYDKPHYDDLVERAKVLVESEKHLESE